jgi:hypothetical protein
MIDESSSPVPFSRFITKKILYIYIYIIKSDPAQWIEFWGKFAIPKSSSTRRLQLSYILWQRYSCRDGQNRCFNQNLCYLLESPPFPQLLVTEKENLFLVL